MLLFASCLDFFVALVKSNCDSDGIRDDIQRWVNKASRGNEAMRPQLKELAILWQDNLRSAYSAQSSNEIQLLIEKKEACLKFLANEERAGVLAGLLRYQMFYTPERIAIQKIIESNKGSGFEIISTPTYTQDEACN